MGWVKLQAQVFVVEKRVAKLCPHGVAPALGISQESYKNASVSDLVLDDPLNTSALLGHDDAKSKSQAGAGTGQPRGKKTSSNAKPAKVRNIQAPWSTNHTVMFMVCVIS